MKLARRNSLRAMLNERANDVGKFVQSFHTHIKERPTTVVERANKKNELLNAPRWSTLTWRSSLPPCFRPNEYIFQHVWVVSRWINPRVVDRVGVFSCARRVRQSERELEIYITTFFFFCGPRCSNKTKKWKRKNHKHHQNNKKRFEITEGKIGSTY